MRFLIPEHERHICSFLPQQGSERALESKKLVLALSMIFIFIFPWSIPICTFDSNRPIYKKLFPYDLF